MEIENSFQEGGPANDGNANVRIGNRSTSGAVATGEGEPELLALGSGGSGNGAGDFGGNGGERGVLVSEQESEIDRVAGGGFSGGGGNGVVGDAGVKNPQSAIRNGGQIEITPAPADELPPAPASELPPQLPPAETVENAEDSNCPDLLNSEYRLELEFKQTRGGTTVKIRERPRFSLNPNQRPPSWVMGVFACGKLTNRQVAALKNKTLPPGVKAALAEGDISYEVLEAIFRRPGKGATEQSRRDGKQWREAQNNPGLSSAEIAGRGGAGREIGGGDDFTRGGELDGDVYGDEITRSEAIN